MALPPFPLDINEDVTSRRSSQSGQTPTGHFRELCALLDVPPPFLIEDPQAVNHKF
ncbi:MAG TPA: hypothetical protein VHN99_05090 [Deinococcales bacterium]|nr:hypothetical protein [Deinococcales bacterium]